MRKTNITEYRNLDVDETGVVVSALPAEIIRYHFFNNSAAVLYLKIYNKATAAVAADTPIQTLALPIKVPVTLNLTDAEIKLNTGLSLRATTGIADADTGAPAANDVSVNLAYVEYAGRVPL